MICLCLLSSKTSVTWLPSGALAGLLGMEETMSYPLKAESLAG